MADLRQIFQSRCRFDEQWFVHFQDRLLHGVSHVPTGPNSMAKGNMSLTRQKLRTAYNGHENDFSRKRESLCD